jgi:hypothetical protein
VVRQLTLDQPIRGSNPLSPAPRFDLKIRDTCGGWDSSRRRDRTGPDEADPAGVSSLDGGPPPRARPSKWRTVGLELRAQPGRWAMVGEMPRSSEHSAVSGLRANGCEATPRRIDGQRVALYARAHELTLVRRGVRQSERPTFALARRPTSSRHAWPELFGLLNKSLAYASGGRGARRAPSPASSASVGLVAYPEGSDPRPPVAPERGSEVGIRVAVRVLASDPDPAVAVE